MRLALILAAAGLVATLVLAPRYRRGIDEERLWDEDPARRAARGEAEDALGVALAGYEDLFAATGDLDALRNRIRTGMLIGAVAMGQPGLNELVKAQIDAYMERRNELDPDGTFIHQVLEQWVHERLNFDWRTLRGFHARSATAMFLAARGDPDGLKMLMTLTATGGFFAEFFPYARARHPGWPAVEPVIRRNLQKKSLGSRVEAGTTLLDYYILFGKGGDLWEQNKDAIRSSFAEMRRRVLSFAQDPETVNNGSTALLGIAMLGLLGFEPERRIIERDRPERYAGQADLMKVARIWIGVDGFDTFDRASRAYRDLLPMAKEQYYGAAAHRFAAIERGLIDGREGEREELIGVLEAAFDEPNNVIRALALQTLVALKADEAQELLHRAIVGRGGFSIDAAALADNIPDPIATFLPAVRSREPDYSSLAAVSLLKRGNTHALQR